eukprot:scaffold252000_cov66-Attheya_sp.AAC.4
MDLNISDKGILNKWFPDAQDTMEWNQRLNELDKAKITWNPEAHPQKFMVFMRHMGPHEKTVTTEPDFPFLREQHFLHIVLHYLQ